MSELICWAIQTSLDSTFMVNAPIDILSPQTFDRCCHRRSHSTHLVQHLRLFISHFLSFYLRTLHSSRQIIYVCQYSCVRRSCLAMLSCLVLTIRWPRDVFSNLLCHQNDEVSSGKSLCEAIQLAHNKSRIEKSARNQCVRLCQASSNQHLDLVTQQENKL